MIGQRRDACRSIPQVGPIRSSGECKQIPCLGELKLTPRPDVSNAQVTRPAVLLKSVLNSILRRKRAGEKPEMKPVVMKVNKQTLRKAKYFFHTGHRNGSA